MKYLVWTMLCLGWKLHLCAQERFSLKESIAYALKHSDRVKQSAWNEKSTLYRNRAALSRALPSINGALDYDYNFAIRRQIIPNFLSPVVYSVLDDEGLVPYPQGRDFGTVPLQFGTQNIASVGLNLNQLLVDASYFVSLKALQMLNDQASLGSTLTQQEVIVLVSKAYWLVLLVEKQKDLIEQNETRLNNMWQEVSAMYEQGFVEKIEVDRLRIEKNLLSAEKSKLKSQQELSRWMLSMEMGRDITEGTTQIQLSDTLNGKELSAPLPEKTLFPSTLPEIQQMELSVALAKIDAQSTLLAYFPTLSLRASGGYNAGHNDLNELFNTDQWFEYGAVGVSLKIPIFQGMYNYNTYQQKKVEVLRAEKARWNLKQRLFLRQQTAQKQWQDEWEKLRIYEEDLSVAEEVYKVAEEKYKQGVGSQLEVLEAASTQREVQTQYYQTLYNVLSAKIDWQKASGNFSHNIE